MRFVLLLARIRTPPRQLAVMPYAHEVPDAAVDLPPVPLLWELAERYHPEQTWLAVLWTRGERSLEYIAQTAPREALARGLIEAARRAESRGLWSSPLTMGVSAPPFPRSKGGGRCDGGSVAPLPKHVVLVAQPWGVRASLRNALLEADRDANQ